MDVILNDVKYLVRRDTEENWENKKPGFITPPLTREILINEVKLWLMAQ